MRLRSIALIVLVLAAALAGCATKGEDATSAATNATGELGNVTSIVDDGTKSASMSGLGHMPHMHDYWKGKERITLFDGELEPNAENATFASLAQFFFGQSVALGGMQFFLPDGQIVYEGTGSMQLTATWSDPRTTGISFIYQSAESRDFKVGGDFENGKPFTLPITPIMTDLPHSKVSKWWFGFGPDKSPGAMLGPFHLKIEIVKLNDIMTFPPHPDFWQGKRALTMIDADHHGAQQSYALRATQPLTQGDFNEDWVNLSALVPIETKAMRFNVTITAATSTPGQVVGFGLFYVPADRSASLRCSVQATPNFPATLTWTIPVTEENSDSPYAKASQWRFLVEPHVSITGQDPQSGGMTNVDYTYHVTTTAFLDESPDAKTCRLG